MDLTLCSTVDPFLLYDSKTLQKIYITKTLLKAVEWIWKISEADCSNSP